MKKLYLAWLICLMAFQVSAQQRWVTGVVADTNGVPVVGATVTVKGGTNGAITNSDGSFRIEASDSDILVFKYLGYDEQEIQVGPRTRIEIELRESAHQLDDVVVTGYQTISKERATGSFDIIDKAQLEKPSGSIASRLIGSAAGLVGTQDAYGTPVFEIRGRSSLSTSATEPLLVVDGFAIEGGFESINPNDVESVTVLKAAVACVDFVVLAIESMSSCTSQPSLNVVGEALKGTERDTGLDFEGLDELSRYYEHVRKVYKANESGMVSPNAQIYKYEIPGGQYSNLLAQVTEMGS